MHKATKAALLSAFIFPGCGHFYLKNKLRGTIYALFSVTCLYVLTQFILKVANDISDKILSGDIPLNIASVSEAVSLQIGSDGGTTPNIASIMLLGCWGIAIADSLILGHNANLD